MNKRILSVFVCCALYYSAQAQDAKGGISTDMMQQIKQSYQGTSTDKAIRNAISNNDIRKLALNQDNMKGMDTHFSVKVNSKGITDQKSSGRCWLFTGLNVMRAKAIDKYHLGSFEFSQTYPFFFDQLEKANLFLQGVIDTSDKPMNDKMVQSVERRRYIHRSSGHRKQIRPRPQRRDARNEQQRKHRPHGESDRSETSRTGVTTP